MNRPPTEPIVSAPIWIGSAVLTATPPFRLRVTAVPARSCRVAPDCTTTVVVSPPRLFEDRVPFTSSVPATATSVFCDTVLSKSKVAAESARIRESASKVIEESTRNSSLLSVAS
jgi:hypothetical protein